MINLRSIFSFLGIATTPAFIVPKSAASATGTDTGKKKSILIVVDIRWVSTSDTNRLGENLRHNGFTAHIVRVHEAPEPIKIIDLSNLPEADLDEVRRLCEEARK